MQKAFIQLTDMDGHQLIVAIDKIITVERLGPYDKTAITLDNNFSDNTLGGANWCVFCKEMPKEVYEKIVWASN